MSAEPKRHYTLEEYLELDRTSEERWEFWDGEVYAMSGGTLPHDVISDNIFGALRDQLRGRPCRVFSSNRLIKVPAAPPYRYADGSVVCGKVETEKYGGVDLLLNPILLWETLSPSTEAINRGDKFTWYKSIPSLREYLLVAQHRPHVTHFFQQAAGKWDYEEINDINADLYLPLVDCTLSLSEVYRDVEFSQESGLHLLRSPSDNIIP